ncbi:MAG: hypothetical protein SOI38_04110 [Eggerthellaceae bacterium]|jgi:hypothetical protein
MTESSTAVADRTATLPRPIDAACTLPADELARDFAGAVPIDRHYLGERALYLDRGYEVDPIRYVPLANIDRIDRRSFPVKTNG